MISELETPYRMNSVRAKTMSSLLHLSKKDFEEHLKARAGQCSVCVCVSMWCVWRVEHLKARAGQCSVCADLKARALWGCPNYGRLWRRWRGEAGLGAVLGCGL